MTTMVKTSAESAEKTMNNTRSRDYFERASRLIPEQTLTLAKAAHNYPPHWAPRYVKSAEGCEVIDVDGNRFIDYTMALGPMILGYNYPRITQAVTEQLQHGTLYSLPHFLEVELAETIERIIPCCERVRFYKNGADVTGMAVRLARAATGRRHVLQSGYHGHHDWYSWVLRDVVEQPGRCGSTGAGGRDRYGYARHGQGPSEHVELRDWFQTYHGDGRSA